MLKAAPSAQDTCLPSISLYTPSLAWGASRYPWCSRPAMKLKILKYTLHIPHVSLSIFSAAVAIHFRNHHTARSINECSPEVHTSERTLVSLRGRGAASSGRGVNVVLDTEQPRLALLDQPRVHCAVVEVGECCNNSSHKPLFLGVDSIPPAIFLVGTSSHWSTLAASMTLCTVIMQASYPPRPPAARTLYSRPWNDQAVAPLVGSTLGHFLILCFMLEFPNFDTFRKTDIPYKHLNE